MGDTLAAFMDQGGGVVVGVFADYAGTIWDLGGRYATQYMPFVKAANSYTAGSIGTIFDPNHPIMVGVSNVSVGNFKTGSTTLQHGVRIAIFAGGTNILAGAFDSLGRRTAELGFWPATFANGQSWGPHNTRMMLNAMCWAAGLCNPSGVEKLPSMGHLPRIFALAPARPNPLRGTTEINYQLPTASQVRITVFNVAGQAVRTLVSGKEDAGYKSVSWNGRNDRGVRVGAGVYLYRMEAGPFAATRKLVVVR